MQPTSVTRGKGLLETWLAHRRAAMADRLIPPGLRDGRLLDIGCGSVPYFLTHTQFREKHGLDKVATFEIEPLRIGRFDAHADAALPFEDGHFEVVTMLAVFEHIERGRLIGLIDEIHRVLRPGGCYILTTPAGWTGPMLSVMKWMGLVSAVEIDEHVGSYSRGTIRGVMRETRFGEAGLTMGAFELGMNTWAKVTKGG